VAPIGVDEWVARSSERRERRSGPRGVFEQLGSRFGWWPRLILAGLVGFAAGHVFSNVNIENVAFNALLYAILALGLNIAVGWAGLLDLGYIAFVGFGAYGYALLSSTALGSDGSGGAHLAAIETFPIVLVAGGLLGLVLGLVALRLTGDYLAIVTLFFGTAFMEVVNNVDPSVLGGVNGLFGLDPIHDFGRQIVSPLGYYYFALVILVVLMAVLHLLDTSRTGRAWRALRDDALAAEVMTIPISKMKLMAFSFGAAVGALGGAIFAAQQDNVFPTNFTANILILIYACLVLGGVGSIAGAVLGGIVVTVAQNMLSSPTDAAYLFYGLILVALVTRVRPWRNLAAVLVGIVVLGLALNAIVGAISPQATAGMAGSAGWIGSVVDHWVIVPDNPATYGNVLYVVTICMLILLVQLKGIRRQIAIVPTVYIAACCWESRLIVNPSITAQIMLGAILIVTMAARPEGLLGSKRIETV